MAAIEIDGRRYEVRAGDNLLQAALTAGENLPYFCWHPELGSVGACRQCAVKQYANPEDRTGRLVMACMTPVADGARFSVADPEARDFRESVVEWLMSNHPHDCPVCEEGGECHLQDMTVMTGHSVRRYRFSKRTHRNQDLGPFIKHEMNRCIGCYRCVRFYRDYAGGQDLAAMASHNNLYFGRHEDGTLESPFSGNLVEVCPTGVFTDKPFSEHYSRKWDLRGAPSVCTHCALGCNTILNERGGRVRRVLNRFNGAVNGYFICDRGRYGYGYNNAASRIRTPLLRDEAGALRPASRADALSRLGDVLRAGGTIGIGSPRASLEANFALRRLVGAENFHLGIAAREQETLRAVIDMLRHRRARLPTLREAQQADAVLVLGEDVPNTAPRLALALRQTVRQASFDAAAREKVPLWLDASVRSIGSDLASPFFVATPAPTSLDELSAMPVRATPDELARLAFAVAHRLDGDAPDAMLPGRLAEAAARIADALAGARRPLVVCGTQCGSPALLHAAANVAEALARREPMAALLPVVPECNSLGLVLLGGEPLDAALEALERGTARGVVVLENDLARRVPADRLRAALRNTPLVLLDHNRSATTALATVVLPAATAAESDGTLVSAEGRAQRFLQVSFPEDDVQDSWRWLRDAAVALGRNDGFSWSTLDDVLGALAEAHPVLAPARDAAPDAGFRVAGNRIRSEPHRFSGRTVSRANISVCDVQPAANADAPLSTTMEGYYGPMPAALVPFFWAPGWNSGQSVGKFQAELGGSMRGGDPGVRLLDAGVPREAYHPAMPDAEDRQADTLLVVPAARLFGSEPLSALAPAIRARMAAPVLSLSPHDAAELSGPLVRLFLDGASHEVAWRVDAGLLDGIATFDAGSAVFPAFSAPLPGRVEAVR